MWTAHYRGYFVGNFLKGRNQSIDLRNCCGHLRIVTDHKVFSVSLHCSKVSRRALSQMKTTGNCPFGPFGEAVLQAPNIRCFMPCVQ